MTAKTTLASLGISYIAIVMVVLIESTGMTATYYVDATGGSDLKNGLSPSTAWQTIAKVNATALMPGDSVLFRRGQVWIQNATALIPPSSGTEVKPITFADYGAGKKPEIRMVRELSSWTLDSGNIYFTPVSGSLHPKLAWEGNVELLGRRSDKSALAKYGDWFYDANVGRLYIYKTIRPATIEITQGNFGIYLDTKSYVSIRNLHVNRTNRDGILIRSSRNVTLDDVDASYCYYHGTQMWNDVGASNNITIKNGEFSYNGGSGISVNRGGSGTNNVIILNNESHHNSRNAENNPNVKDTAGIKVWGGYGSGTVGRNVIIEGNRVYKNEGSFEQKWWRGVGIWVDEWGDGAVVRYNTVYNNKASGIIIEHMSNARVYYNIVYGNGGGWTYHDGIMLFRGVSHSQVYNNVTYENQDAGLSVVGGLRPGEDAMINNAVINNISFNNRRRQLQAHTGGDNSGNGAGNIFEQNSLGVPGSGFIEWGRGITYSTYESWEAAYRRKAASIPVH
jgi:hypothetical protein